MVQLDDIQGNILAGFNTDYQVFVGLAHVESQDWQAGAEWLANRGNDITNVTELRSQRNSMKNADDLTWLCLAVSERVMSSTQPDVLFNDDAFRRGMMRRAGPVLGDRTSPSEWTIGGINNVVDVLLIVASNKQVTAEEHANQLVLSALEAGFVQSYRETASKIKDLEHFGFRDGISQPRVVGSDAHGELEAGNFVFGYPKLPGGAPVTVQDDPRGVTGNGSFLALRRLEQDVQGFRSFCAKEADRIQKQWPGLTSDHLQALIVGRWPSGTLVSTSILTDPGSAQDENNFDFSDDMDGRVCPFGSHIRKVNPRNGPRDVVEVPRLLRRGIPFGPVYDEDPMAKRGLMFVSFQTSIVNSFEFLTSKWMNTPEKPAPAAGHDMLIGRSLTMRSFTIKPSSGPIVISDNGQSWIKPTGGTYLFAPSKSGLKKFNEKSNPSFKTKITRGWMQLTDYLVND